MSPRLKTVLIPLFVVALLLGACHDPMPPKSKIDESESFTITIASRKKEVTYSREDSPIFGQFEYCWVKYDSLSHWIVFGDPIENFDFEPGFEYVLRVKRTTLAEPAADGSPWRFEMEELLSTTKKDSEGLPDEYRLR